MKLFKGTKPGKVNQSQQRDFQVNNAPAKIQKIHVYDASQDSE
jgi:hypothetical protein